MPRESRRAAAPAGANRRHRRLQTPLISVSIAYKHSQLTFITVNTCVTCIAQTLFYSNQLKLYDEHSVRLMHAGAVNKTTALKSQTRTGYNGSIAVFLGVQLKLYGSTSGTHHKYCTEAIALP